MDNQFQCEHATCILRTVSVSEQEPLLWLCVFQTFNKYLGKSFFLFPLEDADYKITFYQFLHYRAFFVHLPCTMFVCTTVG